MRVFELPPQLGPRARGQAHGEAFRPLIAEIAAIRTALTVELGAFRDEGEVLAVARRHLAPLRRFDEQLAEELEGIAQGAGLAPEAIVVLNHYTDLRDLVPARLPADEDCSVLWARGRDGRALAGQTWDMHGSAAPYVMMLGVPEGPDGPAAWCLSLTGCLGMTGLNAAGVAVCINNLKSLDARIGVVWPALVRRALRERSAVAARDVVLHAPLGSGHHYLCADDADAFGIETSGTRKAVVFDARAVPHAHAYVHTNHCLPGSPVGDVSAIGVESTTLERYAWLSQSVRLHPPRDREALWERLGSHDGYPRSVCTHLSSPAQPHGVTTCGAVAMDLRERRMLAAAGCVHRARGIDFGF
ncbi:MAG: C45 family peptidase [Myxococcales bacterium]|nr:C45 family peptidase [Myxococcales bacterium]